jgi:para-nitrobenzyl esterase
VGVTGVYHSPGIVASGVVLAQEYYHGEKLAAQTGAVVVSFNFRLNSFGFLTLPELDTADGSSGGYGNLDQIAVLKWVQRNIKQFGGDPKRVILVGISGGATAIATLYSSPLAEGLFSAAWLGSSLTSHISDKATQQARYDNLLNNLDCSGYPNTVACLRGVSQAEIFEAFVRPIALSIAEGGVANFPFGLGTPSAPVGGPILPEHPKEILADKHFNNKAPIVIGSVDVEFAGFLLSGLTPDRALASYYAYQYLLHKYPNKTEAERLNAMNTGLDLYEIDQDWLGCISDIVYVCGNNELADAAAEGQRSVRRYVFDYVLDGSPIPVAQHGDDNLFISGVLDYAVFLGPRVPAAFEYELSAEIQDSIFRIANKQTPHGWPLYRDNNHAHIRWNDPISIGHDYRDSQCSFWNDPIFTR